MANNWLRFGKQGSDDADDNQGEIKPDAFKAELESSFKKELDALKTEQDSKLAPLIEMANNFKAAQAEAERQRTVANNKTRATELEVDDDLWITNPAEAHRRSNANLVAQTQATAAITMRREVLSDLPYYHGELKEKIDQLIEAQPLSNRANPAILKNAYYTVLGQHTDELNEGKYKKATFGVGLNGSGTGSATGTDTNEKAIELNDDEKSIARSFGMSEKDWLKSKEELGYV
jgi:hypothetical protein